MARFIITTQPGIQIDATPEQNPDGWTECMVTPSIKREIMATPNFPQPLQRPSKTKYEIRSVEGRGLAMFATDHIDVGELILCERPLLMAQAMARGQDVPVAVTDELDPEAENDPELVRQIIFQEKERQLETLVGNMHPKFREQFMALANSHEHDGSGPLFGRLRTNGFGAPGFFDLEGEDHPYSMVGNNISRINHSCCANTKFTFYRPSFGMELRATRLIPQGAEITIPYCDILKPYLDRQKALKPYGFSCDCPACSDLFSSDQIRAVSVNSIGLENDRATVEEVLGWMKRFEDFGLERSRQYIECLRFLRDKYKDQGNLAEVKIYRNKLYKIVLATMGKERVMAVMASL
ncbi:hypothetical protein C8Q75DRAFT_808987 [Abortiporus biennis]|nr:hypothetical protein C8Q75DRAFT_808987 [Abortiporus biennis]